MDEKINKLLQKIGIDEQKDFINAKLEKIIVDKKSNSWVLIISNPSLFPINTIEIFEKKLPLAFSDVNISYKIEITGNTTIAFEQEYFCYLLTKINNNSIYFKDRLIIENESLKIEVYNKMEEKQAQSFIKELNQRRANLGLNKEITVYYNTEKSSSIKQEIAKDLETKIAIPIKGKEKKASIKKDTSSFKENNKTSSNIKDENTILGRLIKDESVNIKDIVGEDNNITVDAYVFGTDYFESAKTSFKIITLKITDYTDSIYCKVFVRDDDDYNDLKNKLKEGKWLKIRGYTKNDIYSKELVLNARDINILEKKIDEVKDTTEIKRVELHAHTMMSQMDSVVEATSLLKQAKKFGHHAIAITDHSGVQAFPDVYHTVCNFNKNLEEGSIPFKAIYGTELVLIDDKIDIVIRGNNTSLLTNTYVVFDFETTGLNAGGNDSIIEIGAVKIKNGEIIDRFDELIDPKHKLASKIIEKTNITDEMLIGKDSEENAVKRFVAWKEDLPMVAHNASFDVSFLEMAYFKYNLGTFTNPVIDTLQLSRILDNTYAKHKLNDVASRYGVEFDESSHHRADYDAEGTALIFHKMILKLVSRNFEKINDLNNLVNKNEIHRFGSSYHLNILVKNKVGLKNLFKIISLANTKYLYKTPRILRSEIENLREGLLLGSGCYESEVFLDARSKSDEELTNIINFYDYVEVQPPESYCHLLETGNFASQKDLLSHLEKIIRVTKEAGKIIVATGDVHQLKKDDTIYREIIVNQKVPGGGRHPLARNNITKIPSQYFLTTDEMLKAFSFLDSNLCDEIVIKNTNLIADMIEDVPVIIETGGIPFSPKIENSAQTVKDLVYTKVHSMYGQDLPEIIQNRVEQELNGIINGGFDVIYLIAQKLVKKSNDDGYLVGSRGSVGSSFVATMMGITEVNPLPAHYLCRNCQTSIFTDDSGNMLSKEYSSGYDLPDKICPKCNMNFGKEGQDMPFATFLGFNADKVPDIDLNFSGDYQWKAHEYTKELFGINNVYRAGTIGTVADKTAFGYVKGYCEDKGILNMRTAEVERIALGCTGIKRTTGQHPGGIVVIPQYMDVFDFTPFQYPADDPNSLWRTTHFDYHAIDQDVLKLDILGHDDPTVLRMLQDLSGIDVTTLPFDDKEVMSLLSSTISLNVTPDDIMCPTGTLGLPELGTNFVIQMLVETKPKTFGELVKISGLSHGTDVWAGNASELIKNDVVPFKEVIGCRDDIMVNLINWGMESKTAFKIMEFVRKGKPTKEPDTWKEHVAKMQEASIPEWYIESCHKIKYMFPKAHACAYVMSALRIAWFKVHHPIWYYTAFFSVRVVDFEIETMIKGKAEIKKRILELQAKGYDATNKESGVIETLKVALEATCRGIKFGNISLDKSDGKNFVIADDNTTLIPPFRTIDGLGDSVSKTIVEERNKQKFLSIEDVQIRGKVSKTIIDKMQNMGVFNDLPESNQLSLF